MAEKREYTMRKHMLRVRRALRKFDDGCFCPAAPNFDWDRCDMTDRWTNNPCDVCQEFVDVDDCPCISLGDDRARQRTIRNLHVAGYTI